MNNAEIKLWRDIMGLTQQKAAEMLGISRVALQNYERGTRLEGGSPVPIPHSIALACAAIEAGLRDWQGMTADMVKNADDAQDFVNWSFDRTRRAAHRYNECAATADNERAMDRTKARHEEAVGLLNSFMNKKEAQ
ncbi:helix-turn-helix domain-containing protein [Candidatus Tokpelaia sp.]|uniref:helix-turn-helix domain-containing protein n=1 Tax=Candidatus Tokpelaia sp. TaxID=2233777 RepID=UPI0012399D64|nr:helix-turn-helix transcriptional regulator [Candidatus Tokpelaia sp.]KAA6405682.1 hypothetical protein DPQ22_03210 [Candidatus Tokpelaia sp.]